MRKLDKKGLSAIVAYVLLIVIALSISGLVYTWLMRTIPGKVEKCPSGVSLIISDYNCDNEKINVSLRNKGRFEIDGFIIKAANRTEGLAIYSLGEDNLHTFGEALGSGDKYSEEFDYSQYNKIERIEVIPTKRTEKGKMLLCKEATIEQIIEECE